MIGFPIVDVTLDYDQSLSLVSFDSLDWTRLSPFAANDADDLNLPADNLVLSISYQYGRDRFIVGDFQTGLATIVLNNDNGEFSAGSGVNTIGGQKLRPGQHLRVVYRLHEDAETILDGTAYTWTGTATNGLLSTDDIADTDTQTGLTDGRTWTAHVNTPGDIDLTVEWAAYDAGTFSANQNEQVRFQGRIHRVEERYDEGGQGSVVVLTVTDYLADLALYEPGPISPTSANIGTDQVFINEIIDALVFTAWDTTGSTFLKAESTTLDGNYLEQARLLARTEGGAVFADHASKQGDVHFLHANWLLQEPRSATVQAVLGTTRLGITQASTEYALERVANDIYYTNSTTTKNETDATSVATYGYRKLRKDTINHDAAEMESIAERDLAILKDPRLVITSIVMRPQNLFEAIFCSNVAIGDLLDVTVTNKGWSYQQNVHVSGIAETWDAISGDWTCNLRLDSREGDQVVT